MADSRVAGILAAVFATLPITFISYALRMTSRFLTKTPLWYDDYFATLALLSTIALNVSKVVSIYTDGLGQHIYDLDLPVPEATLRTQLPYTIARFVYIAAIWFSQMAVAFLYWRLFGISNLRYVIIGMMVYTTCWFIAIFMANMFQCQPVRKAWDSSVEGECHADNYTLFFCMILIHTVLDVAMVAAPISRIRALQMRTWQKFGLGFLFTCGIIACLGSIAAMITNLTVSDAEDVTWNIAETTIWTVIEINIGLAAANLPLIPKAFNEIRKRMSSQQRFGGSDGIEYALNTRQGSEGSKPNKFPTPSDSVQRLAISSRGSDAVSQAYEPK